MLWIRDGTIWRIRSEQPAAEAKKADGASWTVLRIPRPPSLTGREACRKERLSSRVTLIILLRMDRSKSSYLYYYIIYYLYYYIIYYLYYYIIYYLYYYIIYYLYYYIIYYLYYYIIYYKGLVYIYRNMVRVIKNNNNDNSIN